MSTFNREEFVFHYELLPDSDSGPYSETVADLATDCVTTDDVMQEQIDTLMRQLHQVRLLVQDTDGNWLRGDDFGGLAGAIQEVVVTDADRARERDVV